MIGPGGLILAAGGGGDTLDDPYYEIEAAGYGDGTGTLVTSGSGAAGTAGSWTQLAAGGTAGVTVSAWRGFFIDFTAPSAGSSRFLAEVSVDGSTSLVPVFFVPNGGSSRQRLYFPLNIAAGTSVQVRVRHNDSSARTIRAYISGRVPVGSSNSPGLTIAENLLTPVNATSLPSSTSVSLTDTTTYTTLVASTGQAYKAFLVTMAMSSTPTTAQQAAVYLAKGAASSEVIIGSQAFPMGAGSSTQNPHHFSVESHVAASQRLSMRIQAVTVTDSVIVGVMGFR